MSARHCGNDADLRVLQESELDAASGGQACVDYRITILMGKGTLTIGHTDCFGYVIPYASWKAH